jgi:hypothetical protein
MMEITLGSVIRPKSAVRRTATIGAATGVVILMDSIDLSNTAMARCSKSGGMRTIVYEYKIFAGMQCSSGCRQRSA